MTYKVYLAKLKRTDGWPRCVYKVGITKGSDAMDRLTYARPDEPNPICNTFPDIKVMGSVYCKSETDALILEKKIMDTIKGDEQYFHNWFEKTKVSGITEMRKWDYEEIQTVFKLMKEGL